MRCSARPLPGREPARGWLARCCRFSPVDAAASQLGTARSHLTPPRIALGAASPRHEHWYSRLPSLERPLALARSSQGHTRTRAIGAPCARRLGALTWSASCAAQLAWRKSGASSSSWAGLVRAWRVSECLERGPEHACNLLESLPWSSGDSALPAARPAVSEAAAAPNSCGNSHGKRHIEPHLRSGTSRTAMQAN